MNIEKSLKQLAVKLGCCASETACQKNNIGEIIDFIADNYKGGGGGEVKFYPEVITVERPEAVQGGTLTPVKGEQLSVEKNIDVGTYAILQPYCGSYGIGYGKRVLGKCVSSEPKDVVKTIKNTAEQTTSEQPVAGQSLYFYYNGSWAVIDDIVAVNYKYYDGETDFGWFVAKVTDVNSGKFSIEILAKLPSDYNGEKETVTLTLVTSTIEVMAVIDTFDNNTRYLHKIQYNTMATDETAGVELGEICEVIYLLKTSNAITSVSTLNRETPLSAYFIRKELDDTGNLVVNIGYHCTSVSTPHSTVPYGFDFVSSDGTSVSIRPTTGAFTDTVTPL